MSAPSPLDRLRELFAKVDAFFLRAHERHGEAITCHAGCDDCCKRAFSVTAIEAAAIAPAIAALPEGARRALAARARAPRGGGACPALEADGRCAIYEARPLICRTHGLPIRFTPPADDKRRLPTLDACPKNFVGRDLASLDPASVLDQNTLSTVLAALDAAHADARGAPRGERVEMRALCAQD